jgi:hypothetical protein
LIFSFKFKFGEQCLDDQWPPKSDRVVPTYVVNLDLPGFQRWQEVATVYKKEVKRWLIFFFFY